MTSFRSLIAGLVLIGFGTAGPAQAGCHLIDCVENVAIKAHELKGRSCEDLWILRNSIYKDAGYCFKTPRAISWFGNGGCQHDSMASVPLNSLMRSNVQIIRSIERARGCS
ncbi:MAG: YARHG domain-containing protein [Hyphomicrobiaceae bacterium]